MGGIGHMGNEGTWGMGYMCNRAYGQCGHRGEMGYRGRGTHGQ